MTTVDLRRISGVIITLNEEDRIAAAILGLSCCDEVLVLDCGSTDRTVAVARSLGARVEFRPWTGYSDQKNAAAAMASHDWILSIDADEQLSAELAAEICQWKSRPITETAFEMPRRVFYLGAWIRHSGWYPDPKTRLYDRRRGAWKGALHERIATDGITGHLDGDLLHFSYRSIADHLQRIDSYTALAARLTPHRRTLPHLFRLVLGPPAHFVKTLILQAGLFDGWRGWVIAAMAARYVFLRQFRILR